MDTRFFDRDPMNGITRLFHGEEDGSSFTIEEIYDAEPVMDANKAIRANTDENWKGDTHLVASIPMSIYMELVQKGITRDPVALKRWLNDRDNQVFRTRGGRV